MLWVFAAAWVAASVFIAAPMVSIALKTHDLARLFTLAFPAVGVGLLLWALRRSLRIKKFGGSVLQLNTVPPTPGGDLAATIHVARPVPGGGPMQLRLQCILRHRSGTRRNTTNKVLWQESQKLGEVSSSLEGTDIPVCFHIPADAQTTTGFDWNQQILWRLEARGKSGLVNYFARFEVPVGLVPVQEAASRPAPPAPLRHGGAPDPRSKLRERGIDCQPLEDGGLHIHLVAGRRKLIALTVIGLILTGIAVALFLAPLFTNSSAAPTAWQSSIVPDLMRIIFIAFGSLVLLLGGFFDYIAFYNWFVSQDVKVHRGSLVMERRALFFHWGRTFDLRDIAEIVCQQDGEQSNGSGAAATFHGIQLKTRDGKSAWLASNISQADYAAWLTDEINAAFGWLPEG